MYKYFLYIFLLICWISGVQNLNEQYVVSGKENNLNGRMIELFFSGDVMSGRGLDQAMPHSVDPRLYERYIKDARDYVSLLDRQGSTIDQPLSYEWIWGEALEIWKERNTHVRMVNLETSVTTHDEPWPGKGIHYRMHPENVELLTLAKIDVCCLANNHVLDWERKGLEETIKTLNSAGLKYSGAGETIHAARAPAKISIEGHELAVYSAGHASSGVPAFWAASEHRSGLNYLDDLDAQSIDQICRTIQKTSGPDDIVIYSIHWGTNWGYDVPQAHRTFAHRLIDEAGVDIVYGHSSHHPLGFELYKGHLILYGAGDFINDYEGISGKEAYRDDLVLMYFPMINPGDGQLIAMDLIPLKIHRFSLRRASGEEGHWMYNLLKRESEIPGYRLAMEPNGTIRLSPE